jgi:hypothetical protein
MVLNCWWVISNGEPVRLYPSECLMQHVDIEHAKLLILIQCDKLIYLF